jgi:osmoprotectant transport system ATP-binding protein
MIGVRHVSKRFGRVVALDDVSLDVAPGTTHVLLGPSGSGKSTLLRVLLGLVEPDAGEVVLDGVRITPAARARLVGRVGYVVQDGGLYPHLTAAGNVSLPAAAVGWAPARAAARLHVLATLVGFDEAMLARYPAELSGGQRQRVGLMRALVLDPPLLLLDEPLAALDPIVRADLQEELRRIFAALNKTVVLVTHDVREAVVLGAAITLLRAGRVVQQGTFSDLARQPVEPFVTAFLRAQAPPAELRQHLSPC